ncbi:MAG: hypothetical protein ACKO9U_01420 [Dolichospermum sp.]
MILLLFQPKLGQNIPYADPNYLLVAPPILIKMFSKEENVLEVRKYTTPPVNLFPAGGESVTLTSPVTVFPFISSLSS